MSATGRGVRVGILDTGVASMHPALGNSILANYEVGEGGTVERRAEGKDYDEHGTACAGIIHQLAPEAELFSVAILTDSRERLLARWIVGLRFAIEQRWDIVNLSMATAMDSEELRDVCQEAEEAGQILIAARDDGRDSIGYPAGFSSVIGVEMEHFASPFEVRYRHDAAIEVEANGIYIKAPQPGGGWSHYTGSSFACAHVSGLAARCREREPGLNATRFREILREGSIETAGC